MVADASQSLYLGYSAALPKLPSIATYMQCCGTETRNTQMANHKCDMEHVLTPVTFPPKTKMENGETVCFICLRGCGKTRHRIGEEMKEFMGLRLVRDEFLCTGCDIEWRTAKDGGKPKCLLCGTSRRGLILKAIQPDLHPFLNKNGKKIVGDRCCPACYLNGTRNRARGAHPMTDGSCSWDKGTSTEDLWDAATLGVGRSCDPPSGQVVAAEVRERIVDYTSHPVGYTPFEDLERFKADANRSGRGLFDLFEAILKPLRPEKKGRAVAVAMVIEVIAHLIRPHHSRVMWMITSMLAAAGVSHEDLHVLSCSGIGMDSSHLEAHKKAAEAERCRRVDQRLAKADNPVMVIPDDYCGTSRFALLQASGAVQGRPAVANVVVRDLAPLGLPLRVDPTKAPLFPRKFSSADAQRFIQRGAELKKKSDYRPGFYVGQVFFLGTRAQCWAKKRERLWSRL
jgi:hypothetical protein